MLMNVRRALVGAACGATMLATQLWAGPATAAELILAEPVHGVSFLPVYIAVRKGYFKEEGIDLKVTTMAGTAFVSSVLTGQAFAFMGSVDHNANAKANGRELKAVSNLVARANIYLLARSDLMPVKGEPSEYLKGKRIAVATYGRTPNNMLRYMLTKWGLEPGKDVTLIEVDSPVIPVTVGAKQADFGVSSEPFISQGVKKGIWGQPVFSAATQFGPYADTAVSVAGTSVEKNAKNVRGLVKGVMRGLIYANANPKEVLDIAKLEFPTASEEDLVASLDRAFADQIFSTDGFIPVEAWTNGEAVVRQAGILKVPVSYDEVIDMRFVRELQKELGLPQAASGARK